MTLADYYFADGRLTLIPIEQLTPIGMSGEFAALVGERRGWSAARIALFDAGFALYWTRSGALARRTATWMAPRVRHVAVVAEPLSVRPYVQLLNTSAWLLYDSDLDPALSHPEFVAYLLVHGDRMAVTGEVAHTAVQNGAWWLERSEEECTAFSGAAERSTRPDAESFRALAQAVPWLRQLRHEALRPPVVVAPYRAIPDTGLLVPRAREAEPPALVAACERGARQALVAYHARWHEADVAAGRELCDWLAREAPRFLIAAQHGRIVWDADAPERIAGVRDVMRHADGVAVRRVREDLQVVDAHTRRILDALTDPDALPPPAENTEQRGYTYLHASRQLIVYNLHEAGMERLHGPPLPYERAMLGARTVHEWAHLIEAAGWVPLRVSQMQFDERVLALGVQLDAVIAQAPDWARRRTVGEPIARGASLGTTLARQQLARMSDYQANLVARRFMSMLEAETYVRHNIRTLRGSSQPTQLWSMLMRYLYEYQYLRPALGLSRVPDPRTYFLRSTWFVEDFMTAGIVTDDQFDALAEAIGRLGECYAVEESRLRLA